MICEEFGWYFFLDVTKNVILVAVSVKFMWLWLLPLVNCFSPKKASQSSKNYEISRHTLQDFLPLSDIAPWNV